MRMRPSLIEILGILAIGLLCAVAGPGGAARGSGSDRRPGPALGSAAVAARDRPSREVR